MAPSDLVLSEREQLTAELKARIELEQWFGIDLYRLAPAAQSAPEPALPSATAEDPERRRQLEALRREIEDCHNCPLGQTRTKFVFGSGRSNARLMFVGEAPGYEEDRSGEPFVGRAGQLLTRMIEAMGLTREAVFIGNILKCRPPENRTPTPQEMAVCLPYILKQIEIIRPEIICALGAVALKGLLRDPAVSITRMRGKFIDWNGIKLMPTFHPSYLLRMPREKGKAWDDLKTIMRELGLRPPK